MVFKTVLEGAILHIYKKEIQSFLIYVVNSQFS